MEEFKLFAYSVGPIVLAAAAVIIFGIKKRIEDRKDVN